MPETAGEKIVIIVTVCLGVPLLLFLISEAVAKLIDFIHPPGPGATPLSVLSARRKGFSRRKLRLARKLYSEGDFAEAASLLAEILTYFEITNNYAGIASTGFVLAYCYQRKESFDDAIQACKRAIAVPPDHRVSSWFKACHLLGYLLSLMGRTRESIQYLRGAVEQSLRGDDRSIQANTHTALVNALRTIGEIQEADELSRKALELAVESRAAEALIYAQHSRAFLEWARGNRNQAFELLSSAQGLPETQPAADKPRRRQDLLLLTRAWYKEEIGEFEAASSIVSNIHLGADEDLHARADVNLVRIKALGRSGRWQEARSLLDHDELQVKTRTIPCHNAHYEQTMGLIAFAANEYDEASAHLRRALEFFERAEEKHDAALTCKQLAIVYRAMRDPQQADEHRQKSIEAFAALGDEVSVNEVAKI